MSAQKSGQSGRLDRRQHSFWARTSALASRLGLKRLLKRAYTPNGHRWAGQPLDQQTVSRASQAERDKAARREHERGAAPVRGASRLGADLEALTSAPQGRDATHPSYGRTARWVAGRLQQSGVLPAGDGRSGLKRYLQPFEWDQRFTRGRGRSSNVVGIRRGDGSTREAVLVIAHLDGLTAAQKQQIERAAGNGGKPLDMSTYQGANDNASAVAAALYISDALGRLERRSGRPLRRDVVFLFPSAEEEGLKGTEAFARFSKQFGDKRFVAAINFEMIGRGDPNQIKLYGGEDAASTGSNPVYSAGIALRRRGGIARVIPGQEHQPNERWFTRSDHYVMAKGGIPSVMYLGQAGDYHTPTDTMANLDQGTNRAVARHALRLVVELAQRPGSMTEGAQLPLRRVNTGYGGKVY